MIGKILFYLKFNKNIIFFYSLNKDLKNNKTINKIMNQQLI